MKKIEKLWWLSFAFFALFLWSTASTSMADSVTPVKEDSNLAAQKALIEKITEGQIKITKSFKVTEDIQGFVVKTPSEKEMILYVNQKADLLLMGTIINKEGTNLTEQYSQQYIYADVAKKAHEDVVKTLWFQEGQDSAPHKAYLVVDPMCGYCKKQYALLQPLIAKGQLQVRWVMVGYLRPESAGIAANILMAKETDEKIQRLAKHEQSGLKPLSPNDGSLVTTSVFASVSKNTAFFEKYATYFIGTPTFIYINDAHQPQFHPGMILEERMDSVLSHVSADWSV